MDQRVTSCVCNGDWRHPTPYYVLPGPSEACGTTTTSAPVCAGQKSHSIFTYAWDPVLGSDTLTTWTATTTRDVCGFGD